MDTVLISGGVICDEFAKKCIEEIHPDVIIGVDRGLAFCYRNEVLPNYILGDFDSIDPEIISWYKTQDKVPIKEYKPEKDDTDTKIGLELALKLGSDRIFLLGATGGRLDHYMGNLQSLMIPAREGKEAWILDEQNAMTVLAKGRTLKRAESFGKYISFFAMTDVVTNLSLSGFKYTLDGYTLESSNGIGCSNEFAEETAEVSFDQGLLLMVMSGD